MTDLCLKQALFSIRLTPFLTVCALKNSRKRGNETNDIAILDAIG